MAATKTSKRNIPGLPPIQRRVVTKQGTRTAAVLSQADADVETFRLITQQMKELKEEMEALRGRLLVTMQSTNQRVLYTADRSFVVSLRERASWSYSDALEDELTLLKAKQQNEQRKGIAINTPTTYIDGRNAAS
jgi:recombinational DNA repair ATPase RecF